MQCNLQGRDILQWTRLSELSLVNLKIYTVKIDLYVNVDQFTLHFLQHNLSPVKSTMTMEKPQLCTPKIISLNEMIFSLKHNITLNRRQLIDLEIQQID